MKQSQLFSKTKKHAPKDEMAKNASLLIKAGFIHKEMAGVYSYLPLGLRVLNKVAVIIRKEMEKIGGQEILLSSLQNKEIWEKGERWNDESVDIWFKTNFKNGSEVGLGFTHEEPLTNLLTEHINSYKDLPLSIFQIQNKFRNETRAKSGLMRGREFLMKDLYSFSRDEAEHQGFYEKMKEVYTRLFEKLGLSEVFLTYASGGSFAKFSHEFQVISEAGEDTIFVDQEKKIAVNKEVYSDNVLSELDLSKDDLEEKRSIEVGNIFSLGTKFSEPLNLFYLDEKGNKNPVVMGSYGIGLGRIIGTVAETLSDEKGLIWPESIAPFKIHLMHVGDDENAKKEAEKIYQELSEKDIEVLYDDRDVSAGEKFNDSDLLGIPFRAVISKKTLENSDGEMIEIKERKTGSIQMVKSEEIFKLDKLGE